MVGRLVEDQKLRLCCQSCRHGNTLFLTAGQHADFLLIIAESQAGQDIFHLKFFGFLFCRRNTRHRLL